MLKKVIIVVGVLLISLPYVGQEKKATYGFSFGINKTKLEHNLKNSLSNDSRVGFRLGVLADLPLVKGLYFTPKAELSFYRSSLEYTEPGKFNRDYVVLPTGLEGRLHLIYKFREGKELKPFILGGASYILALNGELETFEYSSGSTFTADVGIGVERKFEHFIFAPEFRYSHGLTNVNENPLFNGDIFLHNFAVVLVLKG
jgi:hypothetical protein